MDGGKATATAVCGIVAIDHANLFYRVCSLCERALPDSPSPIPRCQYCSISRNPSSKRLFRVLMSIATDEDVVTVICFDRVARVLFGCSADEFFDFAKLHPFAGVAAGRVLEGEMFRMTLSKPVNGNAQHIRVTSLTPLSSSYQPLIHTLRKTTQQQQQQQQQQQHIIT